jgi:hypothetical protein
MRTAPLFEFPGCQDVGQSGKATGESETLEFCRAVSHDGVGGVCVQGVLGTDHREFRFYPQKVDYFSVGTSVFAGSAGRGPADAQQAMRLWRVIGRLLC